MSSQKKIRVLLVMDSSGHSTGYYVVAKGLQEAGIEVILGGYQIPREIVDTAVEEDVDFIGYRIMDGAPDILVGRLMELLKEKGISGTGVVVGGIIPPAQIPLLKEMGVRGVFTPGTKIQEIVSCIAGEI
ncbi:MAG: cobalamin B12-binding domain-containing protein [Candidatus Tectomicrobia bacterium]|uniref:Cobalamin B12-binding domain-containing protein n=1 Tax=Tectimicrobiota bacterium TaxID=2528274 RepID=A0A932CQB2_UNCTE|nr:cobalamin B12-binding domain-containing protein [Candidatus Tectomicrobia bacterium]